MTIASIQLKHGDYAAAIKNYQGAVDINSRWFGPKDPQTADAQIALGDVMELSGKAKEALPILQAALPVEKALWGDSTVEVNRAYNALGNVERDLGNAREARLYFGKALTGYRALNPNGSTSIATVLYHLAKMDYDDYLYPAAESEAREATVIDNKILRPNDLYTFRSLLLSGLIYKAEHHDTEARSAFSSVCDNLASKAALEVRSQACAELQQVSGVGAR